MAPTLLHASPMQEAALIGARAEVRTRICDVSPHERSVRRLSAKGIEQLVRILTGEAPSAKAVGALWRRTGGDPQQVLVHLLAAVRQGTPLVDALRHLADASPPSPGFGVFRREGDYWTISYQGRTVRLRDAKGLHYLVPLLRSPGSRVSVRDLVQSGGRGYGVDVERARVTVTKGIKLVLDRLQLCYPPLAQHLRASVRRGYWCCYVPDKGHAVSWDI